MNEVPLRDQMRSAYLHFTRNQWCDFRKDTPLTLIESEVKQLQGQVDVVSLTEVEEIYLPLSRLLSLYVIAGQGLHRATSEFLGKGEPKVPYIIGVGGSVAVGKSTTSRILKAILSRWPSHPRVEIITTDGFLLSNHELEKRALMSRKGFPESYDLRRLLNVLYSIKSGKRNIKIPVYSHHHYDVVPDQSEIIDQPDIVILEGLNILQTGVIDDRDKPKLFVSDFFDFSIFVDASAEVIKQWYVSRVLSFWRGPFTKSDSFFHHLTKLKHEEVVKFAERVWREVNEMNLYENILPFRERAQLILCKGESHTVEDVYLRKL